MHIRLAQPPVEDDSELDAVVVAVICDLAPLDDVVDRLAVECAVDVLEVPCFVFEGFFAPC